MSDLCKQCAIELFGPQVADLHDDLVGVTSEKEWAQGIANVAICESCGPTLVDDKGNCAHPKCLKPGHSVKWSIFNRVRGYMRNKVNESLILRLKQIAEGK